MGYTLKSISRFFLLISFLVALLALVGQYRPPGGWVGNSLPLQSLSVWAVRQLPVVLNLLGFIIFVFVMEYVVGLGRSLTREVTKIWIVLPLWLRRTIVVLGALLIPFNLHGIIAYLLESSVSQALSLRYLFWMMSFAPAGLVMLPVSMFNFLYMVMITAVLVIAHIKLPREGHVPLPGVTRTKGPSHTFEFDPASREYRIKRRAERHLEKGKLLKAARLFEKLGHEYSYRAGKLYRQKDREVEAARAFGVAGDYYLRRCNYTRSGDAFFYGGHWEEAADAYQRYKQPQEFLGDWQMVLEWIRRWGECLFRLGRYMEAAELYAGHGLDKLAGEAYEKAGRPHEAAEAYGRAGAFESSFKALKDSGHHELAQVEKGKLHLQRDEYLDAAREFEKGKHFIHAAEAYEKANISGKSARCYLLAGKPETAAELFLAAGEEFQALNCYEVMEDYDKAAQLSAHMGLQDKQAMYYERGGYMIAAARSYLMIYETESAVRCLSQVQVNDETISSECAHLLTLLYQQNRLKEALSCAHSLLEGKKATRVLVPLVFVLARIQEKLGNLEKAFKFYSRVANLIPNSEEYVGHARRIAGRLGREFILKNEKKNDVGSEPVKPILENNQTVADTPASPPKPKKKRKRGTAVGGKVVQGKGSDDITLTIDEQTIYDLTEEGSLKRYQVIKELGRGGMGYVYKALDKKLKRFVALKMLHPEMNNEPRVVLFFKREAMSIAKLNHPNLVSLYDMGKEKGCFYMVMEYLQGSTLKTYVKKNPAVLRKHLITIWLQVCEGLRYAHSSGIIHRDIKPSNIMITRDRRLKVLDFGLAKAVTDLNQTQQLWGTPSFMAPELFQGDRAGFQTDIYGLGATFYMVTTRQEPFTRSTLGRKFAGNGLPTPPHSIDPRIPSELSEVILRCMYVNPEDRFQTVEGLIRQLKKLEKKMKK
ncbi:MAG: protein kinase [Acidobacteriota bacterium]|nr:protein kinase [Acidobacteriota bacterium]